MDESHLLSPIGDREHHHHLCAILRCAPAELVVIFHAVEVLIDDGVVIPAADVLQRSDLPCRPERTDFWPASAHHSHTNQLQKSTLPDLHTP